MFLRKRPVDGWYCGIRSYTSVYETKIRGKSVMVTGKWSLGYFFLSQDHALLVVTQVK